MPKKPLTGKDGEVREAGSADFKRARPARDVLPPEFFTGVKKLRGQRGPQKAPRKVPVSLRLPPDILAHFKKSGRGWQTKIEAALRRAIDVDKNRGK